MTRASRYSLDQFNSRKYCSKSCRGKHTGWQKGRIPEGWKGGVSHANGYRIIFKPDHPAYKGKRYVYEHRLIMETHLGRYLASHEVVHHINGDKLDNRVENLELTTKSEHTKKHPKVRMNGRFT